VSSGFGFGFGFGFGLLERMAAMIRSERELSETLSRYVPTSTAEAVLLTGALAGPIIPISQPKAETFLTKPLRVVGLVGFCR
jgi:hypothetical protein